MDEQGMKREDLDRMKFIRREVEKVLLPYRENTEAALVCGALFQIIRTLLELYPERTRTELLEGAIAFLKKEDLEPRAEGRILPPGLLQ